MTRNEFIRRFPNASKSAIARNVQTVDTGEVAVVERDSGDATLETVKTEKTAAARLHIRFTSCRKRLCDPDNVAVKWTLDCLRYGGVIRGDEPDKITIEVRQEKIAKGETERTVIEVF